MKNKDFIELLRHAKDAEGKRYTIQKLAEGIYAGRVHVNTVLMNHKQEGKPNFGYRTRGKLVKFFKAHFPEWRAMLGALNWDEKGNLVPHGTSDMRQK